MLEYLVLARGHGNLEFGGWKLPSLPVSLAILNGFFLFLYVTRRIFGASPMGAGLMVFAMTVMLAANLAIYFLLTPPF